MGRIDKYSLATRQVAPFVTGVDVAGLALSPKGVIVATAFDKRMLSEFDPVSGKRTDIAGSNLYMGKPLNQTNDLVVRSDGNIRSCSAPAAATGWPSTVPATSTCPPPAPSG